MQVGFTHSINFALLLLLSVLITVIVTSLIVPLPDIVCVLPLTVISIPLALEIILLIVMLSGFLFSLLSVIYNRDFGNIIFKILLFILLFGGFNWLLR